MHFLKDSLLVSGASRKCGCTTTASRKAVAEDIFSFVLKNTEIEWAAIHVGYVAEPPCNCILSSCLLVKFTLDAWLASLHHLLPDFDRSHTVPVPASGAGNRCQVSGFDKVDDLHHLATLAPMAPGITKSHAFLGILSCAFWISFYLLALFGL